MECRSFREQMPEYFAGTMEAQGARALEEHVAVCAECSGEFADYKAMLSALAEPIEVPHEFKSALRHMVMEEAKKQLPTGRTISEFLRNPFFKVLIGATAASLVLLAVGLIWFDRIFPDALPETVVSYVDDRSVGFDTIERRGLAQLLPADSATAEARLFARYNNETAGAMDEKVISIGGEVLNSANKAQPYALYGISPDVLSFFINYLKTIGPVDASLPRITSISSDKVFMIVEIGL